MSREIVVQQSQVSDLSKIAQQVAKSRMFGLDEAQAFTLCLLAEAEGLPPIQAVRRFHVINGRPAMRADAMQAEFQRHGGTVEWVESTAEVCRAVFRHPVHAPKGLEIAVTLEELTRRGVATNPTYKKFPRQMLRARVISEGVRAVDPGIVVGIYTPEEVDEFEPRDRRPIEATARVVEPRGEAERIGDELVEVMEAPPKRGNPRERHQAPADVVAEIRQADVTAYRDVIRHALDGCNAEWAAYCDAMGFEATRLEVNGLQVENHLVTRAVEKGSIKPDEVEDERGKRVREKAADALARLHKRYHDAFAGQVAAYLDGKLKEAKAAMSKAVEGEPAENASQEVHGEGDDQVIIDRAGEVANV